MRILQPTLTVITLLILSMSSVARAGEDARPDTPGWLGLGYEYHKEAEQPGWLLIRGIAPQGPASKVGLEAGDVVTAIDGQALEFTSDLAVLEYLAKVRPRQTLKLEVRRGVDEILVKLRAEVMPAEMVEVWWKNFEMAKAVAERRSEARSPRR